MNALKQRKCLLVILGLFLQITILIIIVCIICAVLSHLFERNSSPALRILLGGELVLCFRFMLTLWV